MIDFCVCETSQEAVRALDYIKNANNFPLEGICASSKVKKPSSQKTVAFSYQRQRITDNKWVFPYPCDCLDSEKKNEFSSGFSYSIEEYDPLWFPQEDQ